MTLSLDLDVYQALRRLHQSQIEPRRVGRGESIAQQLQALDAEEHRLLENPFLVVAQLQATIAPDVRCLIPEPAFRDQVAGWLANRSRLSPDEPDLSSDLDTWHLHRLPFPVQLVEHERLSMTGHTTTKTTTPSTAMNCRCRSALGQKRLGRQLLS